MPRLILMLCCFCGALVAAEQGDDIPLVQDPDRWSCSPNRLEIQQSVNWEHKGTRATEVLGLTLDCLLQAPEELEINFIEPLRLTAIETDAGPMTLTVRTDRHQQRWARRNFRAMNRYQEQSGGYRLSCQLDSLPPQGATVLRSIAGEAICEIVDGDQVKLRLDPVGDWVGKRFAPAEHPEISVTVERLDPLTISMPKNSEALVETMELQSANGEAIKQRGWSGSGNADTMTYDLRVSLPEDGCIVLPLPPPVRRVRVPITLVDIPLPGHLPESLTSPQHPPRRIPAPAGKTPRVDF